MRLRRPVSHSSVVQVGAWLTFARSRDISSPRRGSSEPLLYLCPASATSPIIQPASSESQRTIAPYGTHKSHDRALPPAQGHGHSDDDDDDEENHHAQAPRWWWGEEDYDDEERAGEAEGQAGGDG